MRMQLHHFTFTVRCCVDKHLHSKPMFGQLLHLLSRELPRCLLPISGSLQLPVACASYEEGMVSPSNCSQYMTDIQQTQTTNDSIAKTYRCDARGDQRKTTAVNLLLCISSFIISFNLQCIMPLETGHSCAKWHKSGILIADGKRKRLTRCLGNSFLVRSVREGITTNDEADQVVAEFLTNSIVRNKDFRCGSAVGEIYFLRSCLERQEQEHSASTRS